MLAHFPPQPTPFVGRTKELADIGACLANPVCRLLTITGTGGSGKTRLAAESVRIVADSFPDGAFFVALQPLTSGDLLVPAIARALGISFYGEDHPQTQLLNFLREKSLLLLLDNFEHLLAGTPLVAEILATAAGIKLLVTSREALDLQEEWLYPLGGMQIPPSMYSTLLEDYEAVQLFLYHARRMQPNFDLIQDHEAVIRICKVADGLPLAIELAASWLKGLSAEQVADEMQHNLDFLATTARNIEERHRSLRAAFDQSWKLLSEAERQTFARLSVFRGGFDREAAEQVAGAKLPLLVSLVEKSLVNKLPSDRWDIHELLRQYAEEKLALLPARDSIFALQSRYYANWMHQIEPKLKRSMQLEIMSLIESDFENIRIAWNWALEHNDQDMIGQMVESLYQYGFVHARFRETLEMVDQALRQALSDQVRGRLLARRWGYFHWWSYNDSGEALNSLERALATATAEENTFEAAFCKLMIGYALLKTGANTQARQILEESLSLFHEMDEPFYESWVMHRIGYAYFQMGEVSLGLTWTEKSLGLARSVPNQVAIANCLYNLGGQYLFVGNYEKGRQYCEEALQIVQRIGHQGQISHTTALLAFAAFLRGDFDESWKLAQDSWRLGEEVIAPVWQGYPLSLQIILNCIQGNYQEAIRLENLVESHENSMAYQLYYLACSVLAYCLDDSVGARYYVRETLQLALHEHSVTIEIALLPSAAYVLMNTHPASAVRLLAWVSTSSDSAALWIKQWALVDKLRTDLQNQLSLSPFEVEWNRGASMDWDAVLALLTQELQVVEKVGRDTQSLPEPLTRRETEVLRLLARGLTNPQIAEQLVIGVGTVKTHTLNIYSKLAVSNRAQAIVRAQEAGLL